MDDLIDVVMALNQANDDVIAIRISLQTEFGAASQDLDLEFDVVIEQLDDVQNLWGPVNQAEVDDAEVDLKLRSLQKVIGDNLRDAVAADFNHDADAFFVGFVANVGDAFDFFVANELGDIFNHRRFIHLVRDFGDDDAALAVVHFFDVIFGADGDGADAGGVSIQNAFAAKNRAAGREIRTKQIILHDFGWRQIRVFGQGDRGIDGFGEVMRGHVGGHTDRNALRAVDDQVREAGRQNRRFFFGAVVVCDEINGVLVDIADHFNGEFVHSRFGVTHRGRFIAIDGAEVAVTVNQGVAKGERLGQTDQRQIQRGVAVRVIFTHDVADDTSGFLIRFVRLHARFVHAEDDAALNRFQTVADIRNRTRDDNRHRIA